MLAFAKVSLSINFIRPYELLHQPGNKGHESKSICSSVVKLSGRPSLFPYFAIVILCALISTTTNDCSALSENKS